MHSGWHDYDLGFKKDGKNLKRLAFVMTLVPGLAWGQQTKLSYYESQTALYIPFAINVGTAFGCGFRDEEWVARWLTSTSEVVDNLANKLWPPAPDGMTSAVAEAALIKQFGRISNFEAHAEVVTPDSCFRLRNSGLLATLDRQVEQ